MCFAPYVYPEEYTVDADWPKALGVREQEDQVPRELRHQDAPWARAGARNRCIRSAFGRSHPRKMQKQRHILDAVPAGRTQAQGSTLAHQRVETTVSPTVQPPAQRLGLRLPETLSTSLKGPPSCGLRGTSSNGGPPGEGETPRRCLRYGSMKAGRKSRGKR